MNIRLIFSTIMLTFSLVAIGMNQPTLATTVVLSNVRQFIPASFSFEPINLTLSESSNNWQFTENKLTAVETGNYQINYEAELLGTWHLPTPIPQNYRYTSVVFVAKINDQEIENSKSTVTINSNDSISHQHQFATIIKAGDILTFHVMIQGQNAVYLNSDGDKPGFKATIKKLGSSLVEEAAQAVAKLVKEKKKTLEQLQKEIPAELYQKVLNYL